MASHPVTAPPLRRFRLPRGLGFLLPALVLVGLLTALPVTRIVMISFGDGLGHYQELLRSGVFWSTLRITAEISVVSTVMCLLLGYPFVYLITSFRENIAQRFLLAVVATFWISLIVRVYAWMVILGRRGVINEALLGLGVVDEPLDLLFNRASVIVGMIHYLLPFMLLALYGGMVGIDRGLPLAAQTLGASPAQAFRRVFLPLSLPAVFAGSMLVFVLATGFFVVPSLLGGPGDMTLSVYIERQTFFLNWGTATSSAVLLSGVSIVLFLTVDRLVGLDKLFGAVRR